MKQKKLSAKNFRQKGFTLLEIIVSLSLFIIIIILVNEIYAISQRSYNSNSCQGELSQNARVSFDRMSRELRQSNSIITALPASKDDPLNPPAEQLFFQDGHDADLITYIRYYLNGSDLMRQSKAYYFDADPSAYVAYNSLDQGGYPPNELVIDDRIIGEYFNSIKFWGSNGVINMELNLRKNQNSLNIETLIYSRNR